MDSSIDGRDAIDSKLAQIQHDPRLLSDEEDLALLDTLTQKFDGLDNDGPVRLNQSSIVIDPDSGRVTMDYVFGDKNETSFSNFSDASALILRLPPEKLDNFQVLKYDPKKDEYVEHTSLKGKPEEDVGEFLVRARYYENPSSAAKAEKVLRNKSTNRLLGYNLDSNITFIKRVANSISALDIRQAKVGDVFHEILEPLRKLGSKGQNKVWSALKDAEKKTEDYSQDELMKLFSDDKGMIQAYNSVRRFYKAVYEIRNAKFRDVLSARKGLLSFHHKDTSQSWVKPIYDEKKIDDIVTVWWEEEGRIVSKKSLEDQGIELDFLEIYNGKRHQVDGFTFETTYLAARKGKADLKPLPSKVLHEKPTYLGRHLDTSYIVYKKVKAIVNGAPTTVDEVIAVANNAAAAQRAATKPGVNGKFRRSVEASTKKPNYVDTELNHHHELGMLTNTKFRKDWEDMDITAQESILSPLESLERVRNSMARSVALDEWVDYSVNKWINTYGDIIDGGRVFPWGGQIHLAANVIETPEKIKELAQARLYRKRIQLTAGTSDEQSGTFVMNKLMSWSEDLARASIDLSKRSNQNALRTIPAWTAEMTSEMLSTLSQKNPVVGAKLLGHLTFIVFNASRQLIMQSSQAMIYGGLEHGTRYMATGSAARDLAFLTASLAWKDTSAKGFKNLVKMTAKTSGESEEFFTKMAQDLWDSGTMSSVSSHQWMEYGLRSGATSLRNHAGTYSGKDPSLLTRATRSSGSALRLAARTSSRLGFEAGEGIQRLTAFAVVRNKHVKNGTLKDMTPTDLGVEGIQVAGNMGQYNKAAFQQGMLGIPFQFMSHTTKMLSYMTPRYNVTWWANDVISNRETSQIWLWNTVMFGFKGTPVLYMLNEWLQEKGLYDMTEEEANVWEEGMAGMMMESFIGAFTDTDSNVNYSEVLAPANSIYNDIRIIIDALGIDDMTGLPKVGNVRAATPIGAVLKIAVDGLIKGYPIPISDVTGAAAGGASRLGGTIAKMYHIFDADIKLDTSEQVYSYVTTAARFLPMVDNVFASRIMANSGRLVSKYGTYQTDATLHDAYATALGFKPSSLDELYSLNNALNGPGKQAMLAPTGKQIQKSARDTAMFSFNLLYENELGRMNAEEVIENLMNVRKAAKLAYPDKTDRDIYNKHYFKTLNNLQSKSNRSLSDKLITLLANDYEIINEVGLPRVLTMVKRLPRSEVRDAMMKALEKSIEYEQGLN